MPIMLKAASGKVKSTIQGMAHYINAILRYQKIQI
jgi:hypothetical protein